MHGASGNTAPEHNRIFEAWYEQSFGQDPRDPRDHRVLPAEFDTFDR